MKDKTTDVDRLARHCSLWHGTRQQLETLAGHTLRIAYSAAVRLARRRMLPWCDLDCVAVDAAAWCVGAGLRRYGGRRCAWTTYVSAAAVREAGRLADDRSMRRRLAELARELGDVIGGEDEALEGLRRGHPPQ